MELGVIIGIAFLAWLMWSDKGQKEVFLFYLWSGMILIGATHLLYLFLFK